MRKLLFSIFFLCFVSSLKAQYYDHALGLRIGTTFSLSYKRFILYERHKDLQQAVEGLLSLQIDEWKRDKNAILLEGLYAIHFDLGFDSGFSGFLGGGVYAGVYEQTGRNPYLGGGVTGSFGIEYTFTHAPLNLSLDWKPFVGYPRWSITSGGFTVRYVFPTTWQ